MLEVPVAQVSAPWSVLAAALLLVLASAAAALDGALTARAEGGSLRRGLGAPVAETARLLRQRRRSTLAADRLLWRTGTAGLPLVAVLMVAVVPLGRWTLVDLSVGVVWFNMLDVVVWALVWLTGWGANSFYALVGGYRFLAQALAYELPLMFALTTPAVAAGSLSVTAIAESQHGVWYVVWMPLAFVVFCVGVVGFSVWGPLAPAVADDVAGGVAAELSGPDRLLLQAGRYLLLTAGAALAVPLFLGGGAGPWLPAWCWTVLKTVLVLAGLVAVRRRLPLLRPDRFAEIGWLVLLPATLVQLLVVSVIVVGRS